MFNIKTFIRIFLILAMALSAPVIASAAPSGGKPIIRMAYMLSTSASEDVQFKNSISEILKIGFSKQDFGYALNVYSRYDDLKKDVNKGAVDLVFSFNYDVAQDLMKNNGYKPFMTYSAYKRKKNKACIYAKKGKGGQDIASFKGKKLAVRNGLRFAYYQIARLTGERPDSYFILQTAPSEYSALYSLSLDNVDAALFYAGTLDYQKVSNPGSIKQFREVACAEELSFPPMLVSSRAPAEAVEIVSAILRSLMKDEKYKNYWPLFKMASLRFVSATAEDYVPLGKLYDEASKKGLDKQYDEWMKYNNAK